jgi:uncharacterized protein (TIGR02588 family)
VTVAQRETKRTVKGKTPLLEWHAAGLGLLVVGVMVVVLATDAIRSSGSGPPSLAVEPGEVHPADGRYVLAVTVTNRSEQPAQDVEIEGALGDETSKATVGFVAGRSEAEAGLVFTQDPARSPVALRVLGYEVP